MSSFARISIHASQFPERVRRDLVESLRTRKINHKFHYDSVKQTQKWLALHETYSPARTDPDCGRIYDLGFTEAVRRIQNPCVHLVGLGCGGGQKDARLLELLRLAGKELIYIPADVSAAMVLVARAAAAKIISEANCLPLVCDLATTADLPATLDELLMPFATPARLSGSTAAERPTAFSGAARLITFFGMIPNFEPDMILPLLASLVGPNDYLLFSANLAPGADYWAGIQRILPLYDNALTRDWLMAFLIGLGVEEDDGELRFEVEPNPAKGDLGRIAAYFHFSRSRQIRLDTEQFQFGAGESIRLFFSYRHTPALVRSLLSEHKLKVLDEWITASGEEGVFLVGRG